MEQIFESVCTWNAARYEQVFNQQLFTRLIDEECVEFEAEHVADNKAKAVHELCDVVYVAFGGLWKLGKTWPEVCAAFAVAITLYESDCVNPGLHINSSASTTEEMLGQIVVPALEQMFSYGLDIDEIEECLLAVCKSNDSKPVKKTAADVKANSNDKGAYYVSPIVSITEIVEKANERTRNS